MVILFLLFIDDIKEVRGNVDEKRKFTSEQKPIFKISVLNIRGDQSHEERAGANSSH